MWDANMQCYGAIKVWKQLRREGIGAARYTVERLMRQAGLQGIRRGHVVRTTMAGEVALPAGSYPAPVACLPPQS